jgi:hypothetical protein
MASEFGAAWMGGDVQASGYDSNVSVDSAPGASSNSPHAKRQTLNLNL